MPITSLADARTAAAEFLESTEPDQAETCGDYSTWLTSAVEELLAMCPESYRPDLVAGMGIWALNRMAYAAGADAAYTPAEELKLAPVTEAPWENPCEIRFRHVTTRLHTIPVSLSPGSPVRVMFGSPEDCGVGADNVHLVDASGRYVARISLTSSIEYGQWMRLSGEYLTDLARMWNATDAGVSVGAF
jgi:hypothetical protein